MIVLSLSQLRKCFTLDVIYFSLVYGSPLISTLMTVSTRNSILDPKTFGNQGSRITDRRSKIENHGSKIEDENHGSKIEIRESGVGDRELRIDKRGSNIETFEGLIEDIDAHVQGNNAMLSRLTMALDKALDMQSLIF